jgi:hypothetical protein
MGRLRPAELTPAEWLVLAQLLPAAAVFKAAVRYHGLLRLLAEFQPSRRGQRWLRPVLLGRVERERLYPLVDRVSRVYAGSRRCLLRSLLLNCLLRFRGEPSQVELGVARRGDELLSHAWVSVAGERMGEGEAERVFSSIAPFCSR